MTDNLFDLSTYRGVMASISEKRATLPAVDHNGFPLPPSVPAAALDPAEPPQAPAEPTQPPADFGGGHRGVDVPPPPVHDLSTYQGVRDSIAAKHAALMARPIDANGNFRPAA